MTPPERAVRYGRAQRSLFPVGAFLSNFKDEGTIVDETLSVDKVLIWETYKDTKFEVPLKRDQSYRLLLRPFILILSAQFC